MAKGNRYQRFWRLFDCLHDTFGSRVQGTLEVSLRRFKKSEDSLGWTEKTDTGYRIVVNEAMCYQLWVLILVHELAHVLDWPQSDKKGCDDHGESWGKWYSRVYQEAYGW